MSFTDQKPLIVTVDDVKRNWGGATDGSKFRCSICGHRFQAGDYYRWVYTNNLQGYGGNPFVCKSCDGPDVIEKWKAHCEEWKQIKERFWHQLLWFANSVEQEVMQR